MVTQKFLNESTIARAHERYMESWGNPSVRKAWKGRKPSLQQFINRFRESYEARQLELRGGASTVLAERHMDDVQSVAEAVHEALDSLKPPRFAETDEPERTETQDSSGGRCGARDRDTPGECQLETGHTGRHELRNGSTIITWKNADAPEPETLTVKPKNRDKLPTASQIYYYMHQAKRLNQRFVTIPITRELAARGRSLMGDGMSPTQAILELRKTTT